MKAVVGNALEPFRQDVLDHAAYEQEHRKSFVLDFFRTMILVPVADGEVVVGFDAANRNRRRDEILGQVLGEALATWGDFSFDHKGYKAFWIVLPSSVDIFFNGRVMDMLTEHIEQMILPFAMDHFKRDVRDLLPLVLGIKTARSDQDMQMRIVISGSAGSLQDNNGADIELDSSTGFEDIPQARMPYPYQLAEQFGVSVKPDVEELWNRQYDMTIDDPREETPTDELHPSVGIRLGAGEAE